MKGKPAAYEGPFIKAEDLMAVDRPVSVEITEIVPENTEKDARGQVIDRKILRFKGTQKALILNVINYKVLKINFGPRPESWVGKRVTLVIRWGDYFGDHDLPVIRIHPTQPIPKSLREKFGTERPKQEVTA